MANTADAKRVVLTQAQAAALENAKKLPEFLNTDNILDAQATDPEGWGPGYDALNGLDYDLLAGALAGGYEIGPAHVAVSMESLLQAERITVAGARHTRTIIRTGPGYFQMIGGKAVPADEALAAIQEWAKMPGVTVTLN